MANNRLYIVDPDGNEFMLAKSLGAGWYLWSGNTFSERLSAWLEECNDVSGWGNCREVSTELRLICENDKEYWMSYLTQSEINIKESNDRRWDHEEMIADFTRGGACYFCGCHEEGVIEYDDGEIVNCHVCNRGKVEGMQE